jgi:predicted phage terminase large subunit-like protein
MRSSDSLSRLALALPSLEKIRAEKAKRRLASWCQHVDAAYQVAAHHRKLIDALERAERGELKRLLISMPPRHGKSLTTTTRFPGWFLGRNPTKRVIIATHTAELSEVFSRRCRNEVEAAGEEVFGVRVAGDSSAANRWDIQGQPGGMVAAGVGGAIAGKGADVLVIDDPHADAKAALSKLQRERVWDWYQMDARTRLHPGGIIILVQTRWHEDDLAGRLLSAARKGEGEEFEQVTLPMVSDAGEILWPERYPPEEVESIKKAVGSRVWVSLYQQRPAPAEGKLLKSTWWKFYRAAPRMDLVLASWDMTFKGTASSDYVVGQVWGRSGANFYLLDQVRGQWDFPQTCAQMRAQAAKWRTLSGFLVEDKANGPAVIAQMRNEIPGLVAVEPDGGKEARAAAVSPLIEAGNVFLPEGAPWLADFLDEATSFPFGAHDDQVDAATQALRRLKQSAFSVTVPKTSAGLMSQEL